MTTRHQRMAVKSLQHVHVFMPPQFADILTNYLFQFVVSLFLTNPCIRLQLCASAYGGAENAGVENAGVDKVWKAVRIKYSHVSAN